MKLDRSRVKCVPDCRDPAGAPALAASVEMCCWHQTVWQTLACQPLLQPAHLSKCNVMSRAKQNLPASLVKSHNHTHALADVESKYITCCWLAINHAAGHTPNWQHSHDWQHVLQSASPSEFCRPQILFMISSVTTEILSAARPA